MRVERAAQKADKGDPSALARAPSARTVARLLTVGRERLSKAETITAAAIESGVAVLVEAREIILEFQGIIRRKALVDLDAWIKRATASLVAAFADGVSKDKAAIEAAIASPWSNGQTEGQICKLKLVKRQMYGRGNLDLLQAASSASHKRRIHRKCVRPNFARRNTTIAAERVVRHLERAGFVVMKKTPIGGHSTLGRGFGE
jgi:transposase